MIVTISVNAHHITLGNPGKGVPFTFDLDIPDQYLRRDEVAP